MELAVAQLGGRIVTIGIVVVVAALVTAVASYFFGIYNKLVALKNECDRQMGNLDVLLKARHDELPKLIDTCKGHMQYGQKALLAVTEARTAYLQTETPEQKTEADTQISGALKKLFFVADNFPELKANNTFIELQQSITELEEKIAGQRGAYNLAANEYNLRLGQVPANFVAAILHFLPRAMYPVEESGRENVKLSFT